MSFSDGSRICILFQKLLNRESREYRESRGCRGGAAQQNKSAAVDISCLTGCFQLCRTTDNCELITIHDIME